MADEIKAGDRVRVLDNAPLLLAKDSNRLGTVVSVRPDFARPMTVWVDSQCCDFDCDASEVELVEVAHYAAPGVAMVAMTPDQITALADTVLREVQGRDAISDSIAESIRDSVIIWLQMLARGEVIAC